MRFNSISENANGYLHRAACRYGFHFLSVPSHPGLHSAVLNVECADDEDVEWLWTETPDGRFVSGYQLVPRLKLPT